LLALREEAEELIVRNIIVIVRNIIVRNIPVALPSSAEALTRRPDGNDGISTARKSGVVQRRLCFRVACAWGSLGS
jgi:hypothetical protein